MQRARKRVVGVLVFSIMLSGCVALDWDFEGGVGGGGQAGAGAEGGAGGTGGFGARGGGGVGYGVGCALQ
ncbi:MAG: hypothetical protein HUU21_39800 [Polyangiaceae bacterium]|nr:hypothetical protein [Polyangiaceae bacterium]